MAWQNHHQRPPHAGPSQYGPPSWAQPSWDQHGHAAHQPAPWGGPPPRPGNSGFQPNYAQPSNPHPSSLAAYGQPPYGGASYGGPPLYQQQSPYGQQIPPPMPPTNQPTYGPPRPPYGAPPSSQRQQNRGTPHSSFQRRRTYPSFSHSSIPSGPPPANPTAPNAPGGWPGYGGNQFSYQQGYPGYSASFQQSAVAFNQGGLPVHGNFKGRSASAGQPSLPKFHGRSDNTTSINPSESSSEKDAEAAQSQEPVSRFIGDTGKTFPELYEQPKTIQLGHLDPETRTWILTTEKLDDSPLWKVRSKRQPRIYPRADDEVPIYPGPIALHQWDSFDFDGPMFAKSDEHIDPTSSIGVVIWHPPKQATRAIHSDWKDADVQASKPLPAPLKYGESVSEHLRSEINLAMMDVRDSNDWNLFKDHIDFQPFDSRDEWVTLDSVREHRSRADREEEEENAAAAQEARYARLDRSRSPDVMDNLENILAASEENLSSSSRVQNDPHISSNMEGVESGNLADCGKDDEQEKILAALGVSGSPKPLKEDEAYAQWPVDMRPSHRSPPLQYPPTPDPDPEHRSSPNDRRGLVPPPNRTAQGAHPSHLPPKPPPASNFHPHRNTSHLSPPRSSPVPQLRQPSGTSSVRKRSYESFARRDESSGEEEKKSPAHEDASRHKKRKGPAVPAAYGRR